MKNYATAIIIGAILLSLTLAPSSAGASCGEFEFSRDIHEYIVTATHNGVTYDYYQMEWWEVDGIVLSKYKFYNSQWLYVIGGIMLPNQAMISGDVDQLEDQRFNQCNIWNPEVVGVLLQKSHEKVEVDEVAELKSMVQILLDRINNL